MSASDPEVELLHRALTELADDPDAPPSTVTVASVLAAARAAGGEGGINDPADVADEKVPAAARADAPDTSGVLAGTPGEATPDEATPGEATPVIAATPAEASAAVATPAGELPRETVPDELAVRRARRRRRGVIGLIAAASVAVLAAVVVPVAVLRGSSTTTAADSAAVSATAADSLTTDGGRALAAPSVTTAADAAAGSAAEVAPGQDDGLSEPPAPEPNAGVESVPGDSAPAAAGTAAGPAGQAEVSCWPELSEQAATALSAALPAGAFASLGPLNLDCETNPVAGALLTDPSDRTLTVQVTKADPGSCARTPGGTTVLCVPRGDGSYVVTDGGGMTAAFLYGNGYQVEVGAPAVGGTMPADTGLTPDQLVAVGQAVLGAL